MRNHGAATDVAKRGASIFSKRRCCHPLGLAPHVPFFLHLVHDQGGTAGQTVLGTAPIVSLLRFDGLADGRFCIRLCFVLDCRVVGVGAHTVAGQAETFGFA